MIQTYRMLIGDTYNMYPWFVDIQRLQRVAYRAIVPLGRYMSYMSARPLERFDMSQLPSLLPKAKYTTKCTHAKH